MKSFAYHKPKHFTNQYPYKKKGKGKQQVATSTEVDEFPDKFEEFSFFDCLSTLRVQCLVVPSTLTMVLHVT